MAMVDSVTATIVIGTQPLANASVEICASMKLTYKTSPCERSASKKSATSDGQGHVVFDKVPVGLYRLAFKMGGTWVRGAETSIQLYQPGPTKDLGRLVYAGR